MEVDQQERLRDLTRIDDIVHHPEAAKFIAEAKGAAKGGTPGEEMLKAVEAFMPAVRASTEMGQEFGVKLGLKAEAARSGHLANTPFAYGVLSLLCAIAQARGEIADVSQSGASEGTVRFKTPATIGAFPGEVMFKVAKSGKDCQIDGVAVSPGQMYDAGRGERLLAAIINDLGPRARTYATMRL